MGGCQAHNGKYKFSKIISLKVQIPTSITPVSCFPWSDRLASSFEKMSAKYPSLND